MRIKGKVEREFNRTLQLAYIELSDVKLSKPHIKRDFMDKQPDERELVKSLNQIQDLRLHGGLSNFAVEVGDFVEFEGTVEKIDNMWFFNSTKLIEVHESPSHNKRLSARFRELSHAVPVSRW